MEHADRLLLPGRCLPLRRRGPGGGGDESDPLVTLSYLTQTVTPNILKQVDEQAAKRQSELLAQLNTAIADYKMAVEGRQGPPGDQCLLLRGHSHLRADAGHGGGMRGDAAGGHRHPGGQHGPGLIDVSTGGTLNNGGALTANHLYMATIADRTVRPPPPPSSCWCGESTPSPETGAQTEGPACLFDMPGPFLI